MASDADVIRDVVTSTPETQKDLRKPRYNCIRPKVLNPRQKCLGIPLLKDQRRQLIFRLKASLFDVIGRQPIVVDSFVVLAQIYQAYSLIVSGRVRVMTYHDKIQLTIIIVAPPEQVAEGDRIFRSHAPWMEATHHRTGEKALLSYNVSKGPELSNPMDLNSTPDRKNVIRPDRDL